MVRAATQLHPPRTPVAPRPAATLMWLRDTASGPEVLMTRRSPNASFLPGVFVFPGGRIDDADADAADLAGPAAAALPHLPAAMAALRESFEELGVLHAQDADGRPLAAQELAALRRNEPLYPQLRARGLRLAADALRVAVRWTTDRDVQPRRFDTLFLIGRMPEAQTPLADDSEQFEPVWLRATDALAHHEAGTLPMIFPTLRTLRWLAGFASVDAALAACAAVYTKKACKELGISAEGIVIDCKPFTGTGGPLTLAKFRSEVRFPAHFTAEQKAAVLESVAHCAVKEIVKDGAGIDFQVAEA